MPSLNRSQSKLRNSLMTWSALIMAVLLLVGAMVYRSITGLIADTARVTHTHLVIGTLSETVSLLSDVQGSQRGFVITGQEKYLDPYRAALPRIERNLKSLQELTTDNASQQQRLIPLKKDIADRILLARKVIDARRNQGFTAAQRIVLTGEGKREMDAIRSRIAEMEEEERELLQLRSERAQSSSQLVLAVTEGGILGVILVVILMLDLARRESLRRIKVEEGLEIANARLQDSLSVMERLTSEMTLIAGLAEMLQSCRTQTEAYTVIQRTLPQVLPHATTTLGIINSSQNLVEIVVQVPEDAPITNSLFSPDGCWALRRGHIHVVQDTHSGVLCSHLSAPHLNGDRKIEEQFGATFCLPLIAHGETLGVLTILAKPEQTFSEADQRVAFAVAEHVSLALANLKLQETLRTQSIRDPLSGLFNRRYLEVSFEREITRAQRHKHALSVLMIDVDFFKNFNDSLGHEAGDELLKAFGGFLQSKVRGEDIACRYGGEEFTLILPEASLEAASQRAEHIREGAAQLQVEYRRQRLPAITISVGIAVFPIHGASKEELMRAADAALYRAKKAGRNRVVVATELPVEA